MYQIHKHNPNILYQEYEQNRERKKKNVPNIRTQSTIVSLKFDFESLTKKKVWNNNN